MRWDEEREREERGNERGERVVAAERIGHAVLIHALAHTHFLTCVCGCVKEESKFGPGVCVRE